MVVLGGLQFLMSEVPLYVQQSFAASWLAPWTRGLVFVVCSLGVKMWAWVGGVVGCGVWGVGCGVWGVGCGG